MEDQESDKGLARETNGAEPSGQPVGGGSAGAPSRRRHKKRGRTPRIYHVCDGVTEVLLYAMVIFAPWAFGTTQPLAIRVMVFGGYALGLLLVVKWMVRFERDFRPHRWSTSQNQWITVALAVLTVGLLGWCFVSALNARATFVESELHFEYRDRSISWLPHSYDAPSSWAAFWKYLALACTFWAARDWLLGMTRRERHSNWPKGASEDIGGSSAEGVDYGTSEGVEAEQADAVRWRLPVRLRRLLWVLSINGSLIAAEAILQRLDGTSKLLWVLEPRINRTPESQFGPYAYRGNAAQYLNLIWPVSLGFWWMLRERARRSMRGSVRVGSSPELLLLPCVVVTAAGPIISSSRGGALVALAMMGLAAVLLVLASPGGAFARLGALFLIGLALGVGLYFGWQRLAVRLFNTVYTEDMGGRRLIYETARRMAADYQLLGSGPGTFGPIYPFYLGVPDEKPAWYAHNDYLETRVTFGAIGFYVLLAALALPLVRWFLPGGVSTPWVFAGFVWMSLGGCLLHARFDFPFQIYSVLFTFLLTCCVAMCVSRSSATPSS